MIVYRLFLDVEQGLPLVGECCICVSALLGLGADSAAVGTRSLSNEEAEISR